MRIKYFTILTVVLTVCAMNISCDSVSGNFGISGDASLGKFEKYEKILVDMGMKNDGVDNNDNLIGTGNAYKFTKTGGHGPHNRIVVIADDEGTVLYVMGRGDEDPRTKIWVFMNMLWMHFDGEKPDVGGVLKPATEKHSPIYGDSFDNNDNVGGKWEIFTKMMMFRARLVVSEHADQGLRDWHM
jgi:hypothetical protein